MEAEGSVSDGIQGGMQGQEQAKEEEEQVKEQEQERQRGEELDSLRQRVGRSITLDGSIVDAIKGMTGVLSERSPHICSWGCRAVMNVARSDVEAVSALQEMNALDAVLRCIRLHPDHEAVRTDAAGALRFLFASVHCAKLLDETIVKALVETLTVFGESSVMAVQHCGGACSALSSIRRNRSMLGKGGMLKALLIAAPKHLEEEPTPALSLALTGIADMCENSVANCVRAEKGGALALCRDALFAYTSHPDMLSAVFALLERIAVRDSFRDAVRRETLLPAIVGALTQHASTHVELAESGCRLIARLAQSDENRLQLLVLNILPVIIDVLEVHKDHTNVILFACWAIVELAVSDQPPGHEEGEGAAEEEGGKETSTADTPSTNARPEDVSGGTESPHQQQSTVGSGRSDGTDGDDAFVSQSVPTRYPQSSPARSPTTATTTDPTTMTTTMTTTTTTANSTTTTTANSTSTDAAGHRENGDGMQSERGQSRLSSRRISVVSGTFEGPTTYEAADGLELEDHEETFEEVISAILGNMNKHKTNADVHRYGALALENLASRSERLRVCIAVKDGVHIIISGMKHHMRAPRVLANACHTLSVLATDDTKMHRHITMLRGVERVTKAMLTFAQEEDVQFNGCRLLANLCLTDEVREEIQRKGGHTACLTALDAHRSSFNVLFYGFRFMENMCTQAAVRKSLQNDGRVISICLAGLKAHPHDTDLQISGIRLLERLCFSENERVMASSESVEAVLFAMRAHIRDGDTVASALFTLNSLALNGANRQSIVASEGHALLLAIVKRWRRRPDLIKYACGTLSSLAFKSDKIRQALLAAGTGKAMCDIIQNMMDNPDVVLPGIAVLRNLSSHIKSHRKAVYDAGAFNAVEAVLDAHAGDDHLVYWALGVMNNICREPVVKREAARLGWIAKCLAVMKGHEEVSPAYQAALELWTRLPKPKKQDRHGVCVQQQQNDSVQEMTGSELVSLR